MNKVDIDHFYDIVKKGNPTRDDMLEMIDWVDNTSSFGNTSFTTDDLFLAIAKTGKMNDHDIKYMYEVQNESFRGEPAHTARMLEQGSKELFDELWGDKNTYGKWNKLWRCTHADEKQLEDFWNEVIKSNNKGVDKQWLEAQKREFFRHPNAPSKILNRQLKNKESLMNIALNPNVSGKALQAVFDYAKVHRHDSIFENITRNMGLDWKTIADGVDLKDQLKSMMGHGFIALSERRKYAIYDFFRRKDCPDKAKAVFFEITGDEEFAPQAVKDMFIF